LAQTWPAPIVQVEGLRQISAHVHIIRAYLTEVRDRTVAEKRLGRSVDQAVEAVTAAFGERAPDKARLAGAIRAAYAEAP
jgi:hypothetical protein